MPIQAEASLSALIESSEDPIWSVDLEYRFLTFNLALVKSCEQNFGVRVAVGTRPQDLPPFKLGILGFTYERALAQGAFRIEFQRPSGRFLELSFNPIVVEGKPAGVSVFGKDITERKLAENALVAAEKRYREIFDGAVEETLLNSLIGNERSANAALAAMLGYGSPAELIAALGGTPIASWAFPEDRSRFRARLERDGAVRGFECQLKRKDGSLLWVSVSSRLVCDEDGKPISHQGFVKDITERKRAEMYLRDSGTISSHLRTGCGGNCPSHFQWRDSCLQSPLRGHCRLLPAGALRHDGQADYASGVS